MSQTARGRGRPFARRPKWPPPDPISSDGRLAARVTIGCVLVAALGWFAAGLADSMCAGGCTSTADAGALASALTLPLLVATIAIAWNIGGRPVEPDGSANWRYGLGVIFTIGVAALATRIPSVTCPAGTHMSIFRYCSVTPNSARSTPNEWGWLKGLVDLAGLIVGLTVVSSGRLIKVAAPVAGAVFLAGTAYLLRRVLVV